jgi:hypothetical protein
LAFVTVLVVNPTPASAADGQPCGPVWVHPGLDVWVQTCPDWSPDNWIPVYQYAVYSAPVVGYIYAPGDDWYLCQFPGGTYAMLYRGQNLQNNWWASTMADNGAWGHVPEVFFRGGNNYEPDAALGLC